MSKELSPETKLLACITEAPAGNAMFCALKRATYVLGDNYPEGTAVNYKSGGALGLTAIECDGLMDGWDAQRGPHRFFESTRMKNPQQYDAGFAIGAKCWNFAKANGKIQTCKS